MGRGTDLLLYALVLAFLISVATTYRHNVAVNRRITHLAREIALARAEAEDALRHAAASESGAAGRQSLRRERRAATTLGSGRPLAMPRPAQRAVVARSRSSRRRTISRTR